MNISKPKQQKQVVVVFDWSLVTFALWSRMGSPSYEGKTDVELIEFARNVAESMWYYTNRFPEAEYIIAMDAPSKKYWRVPYLEEYYKKTVELYQDEESNTWVMMYNKAYYFIKYSEISGSWFQVKLKVKELDRVMCTHTRYTGDVPDYLQEFFPRYKKRVSSWTYETSYADFKKAVVGLAKNMAGTIQGKWVMVDKAEADDIAYAVSELYPSRTLVYVTNDADWRQIGASHMFANFIDPIKRQNFVELDRTQAKYDLWVKIIMGDKSDTIPGIALHGKSGLVGKSRAESIVQTVGLAAIGDWLKKNAEIPTLNRNLKLIVLKNTPKEIKDKVKNEIINYKKVVYNPYKWEDYGLELVEKLSIRAQAEFDALNFLPPNG
jgi:hypothetical protein